MGPPNKRMIWSFDGAGGKVTMDTIAQLGAPYNLETIISYLIMIFKCTIHPGAALATNGICTAWECSAKHTVYVLRLFSFPSIVQVYLGGTCVR